MRLENFRNARLNGCDAYDVMSLERPKEALQGVGDGTCISQRGSWNAVKIVLEADGDSHE
jgi:hypothetical protein